MANTELPSEEASRLPAVKAPAWYINFLRDDDMNVSFWVNVLNAKYTVN
jgi:hypothetical protein